MSKKPPKVTAYIHMMEVLEGNIMQEVDFALAESYDDLIGMLPIEVSETEFLFLLTTNTNTPNFLDVKSLNNLTTELAVVIVNNSSHTINSKNLDSNVNFSIPKKLIPLNRVLIDIGMSQTIVSWHAILSELFKNWKVAKKTVWKTNGENL